MAARRLASSLLVLVAALAAACGGGGGGGGATGGSPTITNSSPASGPAGGGTPLTIAGTGFVAPVTVTVGGNAAGSVVLTGTTLINCFTPAGTPGGPVNIAVTTAAGTATRTNAFTYIVAPTVTQATPPNGPAIGGTPVTVTGTGFLAGVSIVRFGAGAATNLFVQSDTTLNCVTPSGTGTVNVTVTTPGGTGTLPNGFAFAASIAPTLSAISPSSGFTPGGDLLTLTGTNYMAPGVGTNSVTVGGAAAGAVTAVDDSTITCTTPAGSVGSPVDVRVNNAQGTATLAGSYEYYGWPPSLLATNRRVNGGTIGTDYAFVRQLICKGKTIYAVWTRGNSGSNRDQYFAKSTDGGSTWSTPAIINTNGGGVSDSGGGLMCCSGQYVYVVYRDDRNNPQSQANEDIYFNRSTDGGATWLNSDVRINTGTAGASDTRDWQVCCDGQTVYVAWAEEVPSSANHWVYIRKSTDAGATWGSPIRVDDTTGGGSRTVVQMACCGQRIYLVWADTRNHSVNYDIYANASADGGATWLTNDVRLNTDTAGTAVSFLPRICCDGATAHVVWYDARSTNGDIRYSRTTNGGASWLTNDIRLDTDTAGAGHSVNPEICCEGSSVYVVWADGRNGQGRDTYFNRSTDAGATWLSNDVRISTDTAGQATNNSPKVCCSGGVVWAAWEDHRNDNRGDIYYTCSKDGGANWLTNDVQLNDDTGVFYTQSVAICCDGAQACFGWSDRRTVPYYEFYFTATKP